MSGFGIVSEKVPTMKSLDSPVKENKEAKSDEAENCDQNATVEEKIDFSNVKIEPLKKKLILKHLASQTLEQLRLKSVLQYQRAKNFYSLHLMMAQA